MSHSLTCEPGVLEMAALIRSGALSPLEAVDAAIARIEKLDGPINAIVVRDFDRARDVAKTLEGQEARSDQPFYGVPMTVKESFDIAGLPTTWGFEQFLDNIAQDDSAVVSGLKAAGAIILGKSNIPPGLADWQSDNAIYGRTSNPHDVGRTPGGSSGGSAAALVAGMVPGEYGSDIAGSIRLPAHFCGVWGHKTTWGAVSNQGHGFPGTHWHDIPLGVPGPLARNGADLSALLEVTLHRPLKLSSKSLTECRFLYLDHHPLANTDERMLLIYENLIDILELNGVTIDRQSDLLPDLAALHSSYLAMLSIMFDLGSPQPTLPWPSLKEWFAMIEAQARCQRSWQNLFKKYDFILAPPFVCPAIMHDNRPMLERTIVINGAEKHVDPFTIAWSGLATYPGLPSTVLPVGEIESLPVGLQVIGEHWRDRDCIETATQLGKLLLR